MIAKYLIQLRQSKLCRKGCCQPPYDVTPLETAMPLGVKGRRSYPLLRLGSYKPMAFWPWVVDERAGESHLLFLLCKGKCLYCPGHLHRLRAVRPALPHQQHHPAKRETRLGAGLHPLHGLHLLLSRGGHRVRQKESWQATVSF